MKRFVRVQGAGQFARYDVPTKEEYEDLIEKLMRTQEDLETRIWRLVQKNISLQDRIAALEKKAEKESPKEVSSASFGTPGKGYWYICDWRP